MVNGEGKDSVGFWDGEYGVIMGGGEVTNMGLSGGVIKPDVIACVGEIGDSNKGCGS